MTVSEERRLLAAYGRLNSLLSGSEDEYQLVEELRKKNLGGRWERIQASFDRASKSHDPVVDRARAALFVSPHQEGLQAQMPPLGSSGATGGGNRAPIDWPKNLEHPQLVSLIEGMAAFSKEEMIEVARESGVDHEDLPYSNLSGLRRELAGYHQRRNSVAKLMSVLVKHRPQTGWAQVIGIAPQKAGTGDTVFGNQYGMTGDFRGANINIGTNITGGRQDR